MSGGEAPGTPHAAPPSYKPSFGGPHHPLKISAGANDYHIQSQNIFIKSVNSDDKFKVEV